MNRTELKTTTFDYASILRGIRPAREMLNTQIAPPPTKYRHKPYLFSHLLKIINLASTLSILIIKLWRNLFKSTMSNLQIHNTYYNCNKHKKLYKAPSWYKKTTD